MPSPFQTRQIARQIGGPTYHPTMLAATKVLNAGDDGLIWLIDLDATFTITLPKLSTVSAGWNATFHNNDEGSGAVTIQPASGDEDTMYGHKIDVTDTVAIADSDAIVFAAASLLGDRLYCESDGTRWYVSAMSSVNNGHTVTDTD